MENEIQKGQGISENETTNDENTLPEGVTDEPQDPEHMDLRTIKDSDKKWLKVYLKVSDDQGHLLDDQPLEEKVINTCKELKTRKYFKVVNHETLIRETKELIETYAISINSAENSAVGTLTKYRIRVGYLLIQLQWLVMKYLNMEWVEYFNKNFKSQQLRSYQDYMRLAKYPSVIKYAWLGKERLIRLTKIIGAPDSADPIGDYLKVFGLEFNPEEEIDYGSIKLKIDVTIYRQKLREKEVYDIPDDKIEAMIQSSVQLTPNVLEQFNEKQEYSRRPDQISRHIDCFWR